MEKIKPEDPVEVPDAGSASVRRRRRPWTSQRVTDWAAALVPIFVVYGILVASGLVLLIKGAGDGSKFRVDIAAAAFSLSSAAVLVFLVLIAPKKGEERWQIESELRIFLQVNSCVFLFFALLGHAPAYLIQLLTLLAASCWVAFACSIAAWLWRKGVPPSEFGDPPFMITLLNLPRLKILAAFIVLIGGSFGILWAKPRSKLGLSEELGRLEHFAFLSLGSLIISAFLWTIVLFLLPVGRRFLVYQVHPEFGWEVPPQGCDALLRAAMLAWLSHLFAAASFAFLGYAIVTLVVLALAKLALWGARPVKNKAKESGLVADAGGPEENPTADGTQLRGAAKAIEADPKDEDDEADKEAETRGLTVLQKKKLKNMQAEKGDRLAKCKRYSVAAAIVGFGCAKVALMFVVFIFDVVFIQKCLVKLETSKYALVKTGSTCGNKTMRTYIGTFEDETADGGRTAAESCAMEVQKKKADAFVLNNGKNSTTYKGKCYIQDDLTVNEDVWEGFTHKAVRPCPNEGGWTAESTIDFYAMQPDRYCPYEGVSHGTRRLKSDGKNVEVLEDDKRTFKYTSANQIPDAIEKFWKSIKLPKVGEGLKNFAKGLMKALHHLMDMRWEIPRDAYFKCVGLRRLFSAVMLLGGVVCLFVIFCIDVLSVLSACKEIAAVRAGEKGGFLGYLVMVGRAQALEQLVLCILQVAINTLSIFRREFYGTFDDNCGYMAKPDTNLKGLKCPNPWHLPIDAIATAILFFSFFCGFLLVLAMFSGAFYGAAPARWAIVALFGKDISLARFGSEEEVVPDLDDVTRRNLARTETLVTPSQNRGRSTLQSMGAFLISPLMGLKISCGIWNTWSSSGYQVGSRQDWYEPLDTGRLKDDEDEEAADNSELVSWKSMYQATSKAISLAWLPLPYGNIFAKGTLYLNEHVVFAFGNDGGGSKEDPAPIHAHFAMDTPRGAHLMNWATKAAQFALLIVISFDLLGKTEEHRLEVLTVCIVIVVLVAAVSVGIDIFRDLLVFTLSKGIVSSVESCLQARVVEAVAKGKQLPTTHGQLDIKLDWQLQGNCPMHQEKVQHCCRELLELPWITKQHPALPAHVKALLRCSKCRKSTRSQVVQRLLKKVAAGDKTIRPGEVTAALLLLLHEVADSDIQHIRCAQAAEIKAKRCLIDATKVYKWTEAGAEWAQAEEDFPWADYVAKGQHLNEGQLQALRQKSIDPDAMRSPPLWTIEGHLVHLQQWAQAEASAEAVAEASKRVETFEDLCAQIERGRRRGLDVEDLPSPDRWLTLKFSAFAKGTSTVAGQWLKDHKELARKESSVEVKVHGEVYLEWEEGQRHDEFDRAHMEVRNVSHQICEVYRDKIDGQEKRRPLEFAEGEEPEDLSVKTNKSFGIRDSHKQMFSDCANCQLVYDVTHTSGCCSKPNGVDSNIDEERWKLKENGIQWVAPPGGASLGSEDSGPDAPAGDGTGQSRQTGSSSSRDKFTQGEQTPLLSSSATGSSLAPVDDTPSTWVRRDRQGYTRPQRMEHGAAWVHEAAGHGAAWVHEVTPASEVSLPKTFSQDMSHLRDQEEIVIRQARESSEWKAAEVLGRFGHGESTSAEVREVSDEAAKRARAKALVKNMVRNRIARDPSSGSLCLEKVADEQADEQEEESANPPVASSKAKQDLEDAVAQDPPDLDKLSLALNEARIMDVEPGVVAMAEAIYNGLEKKQRAGQALMKATQSRMIKDLREALHDARETGTLLGPYIEMGALDQAEELLASEKENARPGLKDALDSGAGVLELKRAIEQFKEAEISDPELLQSAETKLKKIEQREIGIGRLKKGMESNDVALLMAAIEECEKFESEMEPTLKADLDNAREKLAELEVLQSPKSERAKKAWNQLRLAKSVSTGALVVASEMKQTRAGAALRAALAQESPNPELLRLAVTQARAAGVEFSPELAQAEAVAQKEEEKEKLLGAVRHGAATGDAGEMLSSVQKCREVGVDSKKLLFAVGQLIEEQAQAARVVGNHGIGNAVLGGLERERRELHNQQQEVHGGLRVLCRVRPMSQLELDAIAANASLPANSAAAKRDRLPAVLRVDKHTVAIRTAPQVRAETFRLSAVFGPDCIQAEVFPEIRGLVQSAVDGYPVSIIACGPRGGGKTFTMMGGSGERGIVPRIIDELWALRDRDSWRADLQVEAQLFEIYGARQVVDLMGGRSHGASATSMPGQTFASPTSSNRQVLGKREAWNDSSPGSPGGGGLESMAMRRIVDKNELRQLAEEGWKRPSQPSRDRHVVLSMSLRRTNHGTGTSTTSRLVLADLAGMGSKSSEEVSEAYRALESVLKAIAMSEPQVPFRKHALTQALQDCLGGKAKTVLMLNLPPSFSDAKESLAGIALASCGSW